MMRYYIIDEIKKMQKQILPNLYVVFLGGEEAPAREGGKDVRAGNKKANSI